VLERSLALIGEARLDHDAAILDAGGGASTLASDLITSHRGYRTREEALKAAGLRE